MKPKIKTPAFLPSVFTSGNLFCGVLAIIEAFNGNYYRGAWLIILAGFFDSIDGMVARLTHHYSRFGAELDSLSDVVSFVLAPMILIYPLALKNLGLWGSLTAFAFVVAGAIRLARFNANIKSLNEKEIFHGLPTPAAGGVVASFLLFSNAVGYDLSLVRFIPLVIILLSFLMVSDIEYPPIPKMADRSFKSYLIYGGFMLAILGIIKNPNLTLFPILTGYILFGLIWRIYRSSHMEKLKNKRRRKIADS
ncbi:MAG: CDP-diacylglycerol--serine O-phosphatidyltransferase [Candidatus Edwardsbacteria bacterium RIFOXYD12_FULL_50_11]|uniref:CDP-diacylglycerol--serine O-phosphatidyltransferase n=1 Tax=Candidatus Edwardsbacteria bacterium GWF2_54_11 TaxID=1817851 RepID=A0A1F5R107_9BACT|nr:MAG: CDP-diacylglycerol--serine O-phosphatidyltransferase [Candidatus Edwardsbacteria bacterium RifOxyC12_full_54_24]OGF08099.1 MAG: CDP-diacylglycerol--serine O-phosphatidyltransferase [Candidatus Edwardsbacteria bacterium GWF2_54_11]OGF08624.1 MAG: CDP-diacylglycerol--serine O-phosphatidyltransferase [Candidatus Edwardsbacteria bacterium RifOxyA12_full_54_48]OGF11268.1 MAG: CDP-diacylglycerol--serine O-phosphatidyltransferase [Candidatus Edwardsbacteria bacterium GWE2_54_12]OGF16790.1 MAG: